MENEIVSQSNDGVVPELPKWVKILFRVYAVSLFTGLTVSIVRSLYKNVTGDSGVMIDKVLDSGIVTGQVIMSLGFIFTAVVYVLTVIYLIAIYRLKRWSLPLLMLTSVYALIAGVVILVNQNLAGVAEYFRLLIGMLCMGGLSFLAVRYWSYFSGPARRLIIQVPLLLVILPVLVFFVLTQIFTDDSQINDADLVLQPVVLLPQGDNAHYFIPDKSTLSAAQLEIYDTANLYVAQYVGTNKERGENSFVNFNNPEAIVIVNQTKFLTDALILASTKKGYQCPKSVNIYSMLESDICPIGSIRGAAYLTVLRANVEADTGNVDTAIETALSVVRMGHLIADAEQSFLIEHLVGAAVMEAGLASLERTLTQGDTISPERIITTLAALEELKINNDSVVNTLRREYMDLKGLYETFASSSGYFYQHNKTVNQAAIVFRNAVTANAKGCNADTSQEAIEGERMIIELFESKTEWPLISPNFLGKLLNSTVLASLTTFNQRACGINEFNEQIQTLLENKLVDTPEEQMSARVQSE